MRDYVASALAPSSPRWKKRPSTSPSSPSCKVEFPRTAPSYLFEKALPPLPGAAGPASPSINTNASTGIINSTHRTTVPQIPVARQPMLGLGLALDMPSTSIFDANTISTGSPQRLDVTSEYASSTGTNGGHQRVRGLSFGSSSPLSFAGDLKTKGKEKDVDIGKASPKLTRKGSFWSRKRYFNHSPEARTPSTPSVVAPSFSPIKAEQVSPIGSSEKQTPSHVRGLSRSLSSRSFPYRSSPPVMDSGTSCTPTASRIRPSSAKTSRTSNWSGFLHPTAKEKNSAELHGSRLLMPSDKPHRASRPRAQTNPPLLHRLSLNIFSFATSPPSPNPQYLSAIEVATIPSSGKSRTGVSTSARDGETSAAYVQRLVSSVRKADVAGILASSAERFYTESLQLYIDRFDFVNDPLDIAMRKLLMHVGLPRETQQIDRVIEAFARRYLSCNPDLFTSEDHPYILAFSLIMLHTDTFNKSNKRKMTKVDYVKNTKLPGVASEVLECFYDNIVFAPFIFIEDPLDTVGQVISGPSNRLFPSVSTPSLASNGNAGTFLKSNKIDPYYLIVHNLLSPLRVNVHSYIPAENPFSYEGTAGPWDIDKLQHDFSSVAILLVDGPDQWRDSSDTAIVTPQFEVDAAGCFPQIPPLLATTCALKITKVSLLNKKDDILVGGKKATNRKWRSWTVVLTTSHLLFFRDPSFVNTLRSYLESSRERVRLPDYVPFKPDESLAIRDSIAIFDQLYTKYANTLRFVMSDGRQTLLQAPDEKDLNDWIARINYTSTFRTAQIRVRPRNMTGKMVELTGVAAATSHLQDIQHHRRSIQVHNWDNNACSQSSVTLTDNPDQKPHAESEILLRHGRQVPTAPEVDGADQFKATFDQIKADLAAGNCILREMAHDCPVTTSPCGSHCRGSGQMPSRAHVIQSKVEFIQDDIAKIQLLLDSDMRVVHSIARLTPFQKTSRDRLHAALQVIHKRITQLRINLVKLLCYHDTLCRDLSSEVRSWGEAKRIAFQAAKQTLQKHYDGSQSRPMRFMNDSEPGAQKRSRSQSINSSKHSLSISGSFYSAIDHWASPSEAPSSPKDTGVHREQAREAHDSPTLFIHSSSSEASHDRPRVDGLGNGVQEEAEMWDKTRCAQRVSLVRLPSTLLMAKLPRTPST
ncbi:hypothetical protein APHAL10511_006256 [Amanita phalloides]|nr:hypothetical protein APHAL10511_006256 [Amanita phalloides]